MHFLPRKTSLVAETEKCLRQGILSSRWKDRLPGIRRLEEELGVSGWTLRSALQAIAKEGLIRIEHGKACRIRSAAMRRVRSPRSWTVGFLDPVLPPQTRAWSLMWHNELRQRVQSRGGELATYHLPGLFVRNVQALATFLRQNPHDCWIVQRCTRAMQAWFEKADLPTIIAGSTFEGIQLPSLDVDYRALGRHAAGITLAHGHRRIAFVVARLRPAKTPAAGMMELERGLREGLARPDAPNGSELVPLYHNFGDRPSVCRAFVQLLALSPRPTVVIVAHPDTFFTGISFLSQQGIVVPRDLSVVVAEGDPTFVHWIPALTHYQVSHAGMARQMLRMVDAALARILPSDRPVRIMPQFMPGKTLIRRSN